MAEQSHTLDWQVSENVDGHAVVITPNRGGDADGSDYDFVVVCTLTKHKLMDERARLIAAAPELLEALWEAEKALVVVRQNIMVEVIGGNERFEGVPEILANDIAGIRAAIAKATGGSNEGRD